MDDPTVSTRFATPKSAVLIPVPAAEEVVGKWRETHDPAAAGVPAHVTLIVPWLPPFAIDGAAIDRLAEVARSTPAWDFTLTDVAWFGSRVLWLSPSPSEPFRHLISVLAEQFGTLPWAGEFDEVVPHLTVAHAAGDDAAMAAVETGLRRHLPVRCRAEEMWVMVGDGTSWLHTATCPLGLGPLSPRGA